MARNWTKQVILHALRQRGTTAAEIARQNNVSRFAVYAGMVRPYPKVNGMIAGALGKKPQDIWPEYYDSNGKRIGLLVAPRGAR
ncbi:transcriptional regulator [Camelimonas fluminis]|uniref:Transcriptional regulator n=1 Tax=Camelimonas fluminis TaxID=1576911 RepID=A0ABV7UB44_9HYPH|nr:helix-turn-helix domain-containing protein [Camelimonas fluminis]